MNSLRFVALSAQEVRTLREASERGPKYVFRLRCQCVLLSHQGQSITDLTDYFEVSRQTIYSWLNAWEQRGLGGLYTQPGQGRRTKFTNAYKLAVDQYRLATGSLTSKIDTAV